jgi:hypothetical protein
MSIGGIGIHRTTQGILSHSTVVAVIVVSRGRRHSTQSLASCTSAAWPIWKRTVIEGMRPTRSHSARYSSVEIPFSIMPSV